MPRDRNVILELAVLLALSAASAWCLRFPGFYVGDSLVYAMDLLDLLARGLPHVSAKFHGDFSIGYYALAWSLARLSGPPYDLAPWMNGFNAAVSVVFTGLLYVLFARLSTRRWTPLVASLAVLSSPTIWLQSHVGHPGLPALALLVGSLLAMDLALEAGRRGTASLPWWALVALLGAGSVAMRADVVLCAGAYAGLGWYRGARVREVLRPALAVTVGAVLLYLALRLAVLGGVRGPPSAGPADPNPVAFHVSRLLHLRTLLPSVARNLLLWALSSGVAVFALAAVAMLRLRGRLRTLCLLWILPWTLFLPFRGLDFARIVAPTIPPLALLAVEWLEQSLDGCGRAARAGVLAGTLLASQVASAALYLPLVRFYPFRVWFEGRAVAEVPVGFLLPDHLLRVRLSQERMRVAAEVTGRRDTSVGIIGTGPVACTFHLEQAPDLGPRVEDSCRGLRFDRYPGPHGDFLLCDVNANESVRDPVGTFEACLRERGAVLHVTPYSRLPAPARP